MGMSVFRIGMLVAAVMALLVIGLVVWGIVRIARRPASVGNTSAPSDMKFILDSIFPKSGPMQSVPARVIAKRTDLSGNRTSTHFRTSAWYYATFEFQDGRRVEFCVGGPEYGLLVEGDEGILTFHGDWYDSFIRNGMAQYASR